MAESLFRIGTAGWSVPSRYADQIPRGGSHLQRYSQRLNATEINSSFYRPHQRKTYERWAQSTPADFSFSVKIPRAITHDARLEDCDALLERFMSEVTGLGRKLGVLLLQLPPSLSLDRNVAEQFFRSLQRLSDVPVVVEPRHPSWFGRTVDRWLAALGIARVAADPSPVAGAGMPGGWGDVIYYRWHGAPKIYYSDYDDAALVLLKTSLEEDLRRHMQTWCVFDNTALGAALGNALALQRSMNEERGLSA